MTNLVFDIIASDHASKVFKKVSGEVDKSSEKYQRMHKVGAAAGVALGAGLALASAAAVKATKAAALDQQGQANLARTLHAAAGASKAQVAATEDWITAQGKAKGFADDQLRPALSKLAVATGSVTKAQKLASLAMDISTGTGKSLESVSFALAKAQNGNVSGLARLGVQTTKTTGDTMALEKAQTAAKQAQLTYTAAVKAHGKGSAEAGIALDKLKQANQAVGLAQDKTKKTTLSLDQITKNLAQTYGGAASKNAETAAGKQKILQVQMQELQEKIGYALIPVMGKLVDVGTKVIGWIDRNTKLAGILVAAMGGLLAVTVAVSAATKAWAAVTTIANVATKAWAAGQWLLNTAMEANPIGLVVVAIAALLAGLVIAYKHSEKFRAIVNAAFGAVKAAAASVAGFFTHQIPAAFGKVKDAAGKTIGWVKSNWPKILAVLTGPFGLAVLVIAKNWDRIRAGAANAVAWVKGKLGDLVGFVRDIPGRIGDLAGRFLNAGVSLGKAILNGMINGLKSAAGFIGGLISSVKSAINSALHLPLSINIDKGPFHLHQVVIPALARGARDFAGGLALVGERGPEIVGLPRGSNVYPHGTGPSMGRSDDETRLLLDIRDLLRDQPIIVTLDSEVVIRAIRRRNTRKGVATAGI